MNNLVLEMSTHLRPISEKEKEYAKTIFPSTGYYKRNGEVWCHCCGNIEYQIQGILEVDLELGYQCSCQNNIILEQNSRKNNLTESKYYSVVHTYNKWQVIRTFYVQRINHKGCPTKYTINEVYQNWVSQDGKEIIVSKEYTRGVNFLKWYYDTEYVIRKHNQSCTGYYVFEDMFDVTDNYFYPDYNITRKLRKYGWCKAIEKLPYVSVVECMKMLLESRNAETVVKQGQYDVFLWMVRSKKQELEYMPQMNICHRNHYVITDASIYFDMLSFMNMIGKDTHNPKFICPDDLYKAHEIALASYKKIEKKVTEEEKRKQAEKENKIYVKEKEKFFGIRITDGELSIKVLQSVLEFIDEGNSMHHCVYENEYYKKKDCLILSAKVNGKRMETVEVSLKTFKVIQSRAACNKTSAYHNRIIELVKRNMGLIRRAAL